MAERTTSAAKDILTPREEALLENYGVARNHFEHARDPTISRQHTDLAREAAAQEARDERGSILAEPGARHPEFQKMAQRGEEDRGGDQRDSKMVGNDRPRHDMRPPEEIARPSDRETFDRKWFEEAAQAREQSNTMDREFDRD